MALVPAFRTVNQGFQPGLTNRVPVRDSDSRTPLYQLGLHAGAVFTVDTATVWVCRLRPVQRKSSMLTVRLTVRNGGTRAV